MKNSIKGRVDTHTTHKLTPFKFYHGTSSIFIDSIKKTGLGGINPNIDFKNLEVLNYLFLKAEKYLSDNIEYQKIRTSTMAMVNQGAIDYKDPSGQIQRLHFRHDGIYVALSHMRAIVYASTNKFGSEILQRCLTLLAMLHGKIPDFAIPSEINLFKMDSLLNLSPEPIIIEVSDVDDEDLLKEDGKTAKEALDFLRRTIPHLTEKEKYEFFQYCNYELLKPVPVEKLKFFELSFKGHPRNRDFEYKLIDC